MDPQPFENFFLQAYRLVMVLFRTVGGFALNQIMGVYDQFQGGNLGLWQLVVLAVGTYIALRFFGKDAAASVANAFTNAFSACINFLLACVRALVPFVLFSVTLAITFLVANFQNQRAMSDVWAVVRFFQGLLPSSSPSRPTRPRQRLREDWIDPSAPSESWFTWPSGMPSIDTKTVTSPVGLIIIGIILFSLFLLYRRWRRG